MTSTIWGLEKFTLFKDVNAMEMREVAKICNKISYQKGDIITDVKDTSHDIFVLIEGRVDIVSLNGISLYRVSPGEVFGELAMVPNIKRTAVAIAREDSWVLVMNNNHLEKLGEEYPDIHKKVYQNTVHSLGVKLARANKLIELLKTELTKSLKTKR